MRHFSESWFAVLPEFSILLSSRRFLRGSVDSTVVRETVWSVKRQPGAPFVASFGVLFYCVHPRRMSPQFWPSTVVAVLSAPYTMEYLESVTCGTAIILPSS